MSKEKYGITDAHYLCDSAIFNTETDEILRLYQICDLLNEQDQKIKDLEHRLSNCIEPKFKVGDKVYANTVAYWEKDKPVRHTTQEEVEEIIYFYKLKGYWLKDWKKEEIFATEEEAKAKLRRLEDE